MLCFYVDLLLIILFIMAVESIHLHWTFKKRLINHYKLLVSLIKANMPLCIVNVLADWISKLFVTIKWDNHFSYWFPVRRFVVMLGKVVCYRRACLQFYESFIVCIRSCDLGSYVNRAIVSCILYVDNIILLSASLSALQKMLHVLRQTSNELLLEFNASKSFCAVFETPPTSLPQLCLGSDLPEWSRE